MKRIQTVLAVLLTALAVWMAHRLVLPSADRPETDAVPVAPATPRPDAKGAERPQPPARTIVAADIGGERETCAEPEVEFEATAEHEEPEEADEAKVTAFEDLTDRWSEPAKGGVGMKDVAAFVAAFRAVPADRRDECIHRALNLIPDENALVLAGVLMDKTMDRETVGTVFSDFLNRGEDVKMPVLRQILNDPSHPCREDAGWILD